MHKSINEKKIKNLKLFTESFDVDNINLYHNKIIKTFDIFFANLGSKKLDNISIISKEDHSVRFIGSSTNIFKKYLLNNEIQNNGYYSIQKCLRTRNLKTFFSDADFSEWSSYFNVLGAILPPENVKVLFETILFFLLEIGIDRKRIRVSFHPDDIDLIDSVNFFCKINNISVKIDSFDNLQKYRHKYGLAEVYGRNFNISLENEKTGDFKDIGNLILIENNSGPIAVEVGIGIETLISRIFGLNNSIEASLISMFVVFKNNFYYKFFDALSASVAMLESGVKPGPKSREYLLKVYIISLCYLKDKINIDFQEIKEIIENYEKEEFYKNSYISNRLINYMKIYNEKVCIYIK